MKTAIEILDEVFKEEGSVFEINYPKKCVIEAMKRYAEQVVDEDRESISEHFKHYSGVINKTPKLELK